MDLEPISRVGAKEARADSPLNPVQYHTHDGLNSPLLDFNDLLDAPAGSAKTATFVIGPSSNSDSDTYDYVTDGTDDDVEIQAAIDALPDDGGRIVFREGTYTLGSETVTVAKNGVTLQGQGKGTIITCKNAFDKTLFLLGGSASGWTKCVIRDFYFDGNQSQQSGTRYIIDNDSNGTDPVSVVEILDNYFTNSRTAAISHANAAATTMIIRGNYFVNWRSGSPVLSILGPNIVEGNYFSTTSTTSTYIVGTGSNDALIIGNDFDLPASYNTICVDDVGVVTGNRFTVGATAGASCVVINDSRLINDNSIVFGASANAASTGIKDCDLVGDDNYIFLAGVGISPLPVVTTQFDKAANTTLANVTGLTKSVLAGRYYRFEAVLFVDADATGGSKYAIAGGCTATTIKYEITLTDDSTSANTITSRQTALAGSAGQAGTTAGLCRIVGLIKVNAAGTLTVQFAQNAANGTSSVLVGSYFNVQQLT